MPKLNFFKTAAAMLVLMAAGPAFAQVSSTVSDVTFNATLQETLTVSLDQSAIAFALSSGSAVNAGDNAITATTSWVLGAGRTDVKLYAYFDDATSALSLGSYKIASSAVTAAKSGSTLGAFTGVVPFGTGLTVFDKAITDTNRTSSDTSTITLNIDLTATPQLPAGIYAGTLHFQAQATT